MTNVVVSVIILAVVVSAVYYIMKEKKKGSACIGCPSSGKCSRCHCSNVENN